MNKGFKMNILISKNKKQAIKKLSIAVLTSMFLTTNSLNASGIPTVDVAAIAQAVMNYAQMMKDYTMPVSYTHLTLPTTF